MTEKNKRAAMYCGAAIIAVLLFLWLRKRANTTIVNQGDLNLDGMDPFGVPIYRGGGPIIIPGLVLGGDRLTAITACGMDCNGPSLDRPQVAGTTLVFNAANTGPNIAHYYAPTAPKVECPPFYQMWNGTCQPMFYRAG